MPPIQGHQVGMIFTSAVAAVNMYKCMLSSLKEESLHVRPTQQQTVS